MLMLIHNKFNQFEYVFCRSRIKHRSREIPAEKEERRVRSGRSGSLLNGHSAAGAATITERDRINRPKTGYRGTRASARLREPPERPF